MKRRKRVCVSFAYPITKNWYPIWPLIHGAERKYRQWHLGKLALAAGTIKYPTTKHFGWNLDNGIK